MTDVWSTLGQFWPVPFAANLTQGRGGGCASDLDCWHPVPAPSGVDLSKQGQLFQSALPFNQQFRGAPSHPLTH